jgi:hypothetical protein
MACDAPPQPLEPPAWHIPAQASQVESVMLGFVTFGTSEQVQRAGHAVEEQGIRCGILKADDGRTELMAIFDKRTTQQTAFSLYKRVLEGEFGTTDTGYILAPASSLKKQ